jgi:hypothetical protein
MKVLSARTPRSSGSPARLRACAGGGETWNGYGAGPADSGPRPVDHLAHGVEHAAKPGFRRPQVTRRRDRSSAASAARHQGPQTAWSAHGRQKIRPPRTGFLRRCRPKCSTAHPPTHAAVDFDSVDAVYLLGEHFHHLCPVIPRRAPLKQPGLMEARGTPRNYRVALPPRFRP